MTQVRYQLTDRNLKRIAEAVQLPYNVRNMAQKVLDDRAKDNARREAIKR